jgi:hypothetical protein
VDVVRHIIDRDQFLFLLRHNSSDEFLEFIVVLRWDDILTSLYGKYDMDIDLGIGIGHAQKMPLLTELENSFLGWVVSTNISPLRGLGSV